MVHKALIFDSGVGGLSIYQAIKAELPELQISYVLDNAYFPYGQLSSETIVPRCCHIISKLTAEFDFDIVVIACNTASTLVLEELRGLISVPVVGVVPAIKPAVELSQKQCIGVLATPTTIQGHYLDRLITEYAPGHNVLKMGSLTLVKQAERKIVRQHVDLDCIREELNPWLAEAGRTFDVIVLGCTHFPLIEDELKCVMPGVRWINSGAAIARRVATLLQQLRHPQQIPKVYNRANCGAATVFYTEKSAVLSLLEHRLIDMGFRSLRLFTI